MYHRLSNDFRAATSVVSQSIPELKGDEILVRRLFAGVNASDVNFTSGRYFGKPADAEKMLPFDAGFEAVGVVASVGPSIKRTLPDLIFESFSSQPHQMVFQTFPLSFSKLHACLHSWPPLTTVGLAVLAQSQWLCNLSAPLKMHDLQRRRMCGRCKIIPFVPLRANFAEARKGRCSVGLKVGAQVAELTYGGFSEWAIVKEKLAIPVPASSGEIIGLLTTGLTASIGEKAP